MLTLMTFGKVELRIKSCIKSSTPELLFTTNIQIKLKIKFQIYLTTMYLLTIIAYTAVGPLQEVNGLKNGQKMIENASVQK